VKAFLQWRHYILGRETVIHTDHKPLQFMQTQRKLQNDRHQKWSTYLQQFHLNIKYKIGSTNCVTDFLSRPPVAALTMVLDSCGHETSGWPQLYETDPDFSTTYQMLGANTVVDNFHLLHSIKQASEADLGIPLQSSGRTLRHLKDSGDAT
jgi:hypothetical protein